MNTYVAWVIFMGALSKICLRSSNKLTFQLYRYVCQHPKENVNIVWRKKNYNHNRNIEVGYYMS